MMRTSLHRMLPAVIAGCLASAGCAHDDGVVSSSLESSVQPQASTVAAPEPTQVSGRSLAVLPGHAIIAVKTSRYPDGLREDVAFARGPVRTIGNGMTIVARTGSRATLEEHAPLFKPSEAAIRSEIGAQFPHVAMQVVERESANAYGPYGLALGRVGADVRCLYAWQYIDANRLPADVAVREPMSVRVRLCQAGTTFDAMAAEMDHLVIGPAADAEIAVASPGDERDADKPSAPAKHKVKLLASRATHVAKQAAPRVVETRASVAAVEPVTAPIGTDLPPEAYLGPKTSGAPSASAASHN